MGAALSTGFLRDYKYGSRQTDARSGEMKTVDRELASAKEYAAWLRLYLTDYFMVSGDFGLEVLPEESIR